MGRGRPRKQVDEKVLEDLAGLGCTVEEMATLLEVSKDTLERNFAATITKGRDAAKASIRRMQFSSAKKGSTAMQIWLGKQYLGQADKQEFKSTSDPLTELLTEFRNQHQRLGDDAA